MAREATLTVETMERENTRDIPIRITASYIFAGPAVQPGKDCFQCFRRSLEDNESYLAGILAGTESSADFPEGLHGRVPAGSLPSARAVRGGKGSCGYSAD